ncbi:MAG: alpha/beta hydrolase [Magnetospiraceae bacterium]
MIKSVIVLCLVALVTYGAIVLYLYVSQRRMVFVPDTSRPHPSASDAPEMIPEATKTPDGLTLIWWYKAAPRGRPTIVIFHGNAGNLASRDFKARVYLDAGFGVVLAEYRGYGGNPGNPTEEGLYIDARTILDDLVRKGVRPELTVLYGESLGTGVAIQMATEGRGAAVVLEAPYTTLPDMAANYYPWAPVRQLMKDRFESIEKIGNLSIPILVMHGDEDRTIPVFMARDLAAAATGTAQLVIFPGGGHTDLYSHGAAARVVGFLEQQFKTRRIRDADHSATPISE